MKRSISVRNFFRFRLHTNAVPARKHLGSLMEVAFLSVFHQLRLNIVITVCSEFTNLSDDIDKFDKQDLQRIIPLL